MKTIHQSIDIHATKEAIWAAVINENKYKLWTAAFHEGSRFEGIWQKGSRLKFLAKDANGVDMGMISEVVVFEHLSDIGIKPVGFVGEGQEDYESEALKEWTQTLESYHIEAIAEGVQRFTVTQTIPEEHFKMLNDSWALALVKLKEVCEQDLHPFSKIEISAVIDAAIEDVWTYWTSGEKMVKWNFASDDWHCPQAAVDLRVGGDFTATMAAKDGSFAFDFGGTYTEIVPYKRLVSQIGDGRMIWVDFEVLSPNQVKVVEVFEAEGENSLDMQREGWQAILNNFKKAVEAKL